MIEWAVTSSVLILVVLALRRVLMGRISLRLQYGLWALVLVRLLLPVSLGETAWSVLNVTRIMTGEIGPAVSASEEDGTPVTPELSVVVPDGATDPQLSTAEPDTSFQSELPQIESAVAAHQAPEGMAAVLGIVTAVWVVGAAGMGLWLLWVNLRFARTLRRSRCSLEAADCPLPVYVTGAVQTPCLFGLLRPGIYVTEEVAADETVLRHSLAHELTHFRHGDPIWAALRGLCLVLHWYNPLVWLASVLSQRDGELCCDEATVKRLGEGERASYGRTLLAVTCQGHGSPLLTATSMTGSGIKERILLLAKRPRTAVCTLVVVALISAAAVGCTFTGAQKSGGEADITLAEGIQVPQAVADYAREYVEEQRTFYTTQEGYEMTGAEIVGLTEISTGTAAENHGVSMYRLEYRLQAADPDSVVLTDGGTMEDGAITEWSSAGQPYLLLGWEESGEERTWEPLGVIHDTTISQEYGTPEMLEEYGDAYTAAAMECYKSWQEPVTELLSADLDREGKNETISVVKENPQVWQLVVTKADGTELFREDAGTPHVGWNSLYLCRDNQYGDCLLRYNPYTSTGFASYSYTLFTLEGGTPTVLQEGNLDFEIRQASERAEELMDFADEVNGLLRHSSLLLSTQNGEVTIGPADWGEHLEHLSGVGDFLTEKELEGYRTAFWPEIMNGEAVAGVNPVSAFFTSYYERPEELNFEEFLRYLPGSGLVKENGDDPEFQALTAHPLWPFDGSLIPVPIHRYSRQTVDQVLEQYAGITTRDLSGVGMDTVIYLEEYDAWYNFTSDYGPGMFIPVYGRREGSTVTLWEQPAGDGTPGDVLTLEGTADHFRIRSHLPGV